MALIVIGALIACAFLAVAAVWGRRMAPRRTAADALVEVGIAWADRVRAEIVAAERELYWITRDERLAWERDRPAGDLSRMTARRLTEAQRAAYALTPDALKTLVAEANERIRLRALAERADFFATIESAPLTEEQASAVVTMDNRVQLIASAGSGKTSVMVARAAYAVRYGLVAPERILLLAFNRDAAQELQRRVRDRFASAGIDATGVTATTFHAFGLQAIGNATGRKPRLAGWLDDGSGSRVVSQIVDELRDQDPTFRFKWDMYRLLFARMGDEGEDAAPDGYDRRTRTTGFATMSGDVVKSEGERLIADWLFLNGIRFEYERAYEHDVADATHSQYRPDFFYPDIDVWHEHWAIGRDGKPPAEFEGYADSMRWKRNLHRQYGTTLIETTWTEILDATGFGPLHDELADRGVVFDWNPERARGADAVTHEDLARLVRTFMAHAKSNSYSRADLEARWVAAGRSYRSRVFLDIYWPIHEAWEARLRSDDAIDFEDMLIKAADHVEAGFDPGYDMVLVDEFQDASPARARLVRALVDLPDRYLLTVGDDWQAINRFAGADISVMTDFNRWFGEGPTLLLQTTFRCTQVIADTAANFIRKNPRQLTKQVHAFRHGLQVPVSLVRLGAEEEIPDAIDSWLSSMSARGDEATVDVLGRYGFERDLMPDVRYPNLTVTFRTAHSSKGLEADYVLIPRMVSGTFGFPSAIVDDPVLRMVMSDADAFPRGEERRLFYVALTRARREVTLMTVAGHESPFVTELVADGALDESPLSTAAAIAVCPTCRRGTLVLRHSRYGDFYGCSHFPACRHRAKTGPLF